MIKVEDAIKFFNNCKSKYLRRFKEKTPEGNCIKGWICNKPNRYLGSLLIDEVNGESWEQFIQSMPKIEYFTDERDICLDKDLCGASFVDAVAYEKLDGSCLILYPIIDEKGFVVEVVPKTRGRAVADKSFIDLYDKIDKSNIWSYFANNKGILFFEMYGILNQHEIIHYETGIDLKLIGCYDKCEFGKPYDLWRLSYYYKFDLPDEMFRIYYNKVLPCSRKYRWYYKDIQIEDEFAPTRVDAIDKIIEFLEYLNKVYNQLYGRYATEGVVINCVNNKGEQKYIKVKPRDIENKHRSENGVPKTSIRKEVFKYFDEYGSDVDEIYKNDKNHHTEYLHRMLSEEYDEVVIQKSSKKIEKIFMDIWNAKQVPVSLHKISEELFDKYSDKGIVYCMRMFSQEYPYKKKDAKTVYHVLEKLFIKNNMEL